MDEIAERDLAYFDARVDQIALGTGVSLDTPEGLYDAGTAYLRMNQLDKAMSMFGRALEQDPTLADAYNAKGVILTRRRQYDDAMQHYQKALSLNPLDAGIRLNIALTYQLQGRQEEASMEYRRVKEADLELAERVSSLFGARPSTEVPPSTSVQPDRLKRIAAENAYNEGASYLDLGSLEKAMESFERALSLNPELAHASNAMGVIQTRRRNYDDAIELFRKAVSLAEDNTGFRWNLVVVYHLQGRRTEALEEYNRVIQIDPGYEGRAGFLGGTAREAQELKEEQGGE